MAGPAHKVERGPTATPSFRPSPSAAPEGGHPPEGRQVSISDPQDVVRRLPRCTRSGSNSAMGGFSWSFALSVLALACSVLAYVVAARKTPSAFAEQAKRIAAEALAKWDTEAKLFEATRERWTQEFAGIADRCDETMERTESKRRRIAASESRGNGAAAQPDADPWSGMTRAQIIDTARAARRGA